MSGDALDRVLVESADRFHLAPPPPSNHEAVLRLERPDPVLVAGAGFTLGGVLVPLQRQPDTWGVTWGIVTQHVVIAVEATSFAVRRLSYRAWRRVHYLGLAVFWTATLHGVLVGTDTGNWLLRATALILVVAVAVVSVHRVRFGLRHPRDQVQPLPT